MRDPAALRVGEAIPPLSAPPISRLTLALYAGASGDHNPVHVDLDFARDNGLEDVLAHGMLAMAYMGRALTGWVPQAAIASLSARFVSPVPVHDRLTVTGTVTHRFEQAGEDRVGLSLAVVNQDGERRVTGEAVLRAATR